jgi:uncharacterized protein (DUF1501 family)
LAIIQGVGYPNPNRSHFASMDVWHTSRLDPEQRASFGWLGRALDDVRSLPSGVPASIFVGGGRLPIALRGRRSVASAVSRPDDFDLDAAARPKDPTPPTVSGSDLLTFLQRSTLDAYATADRMSGILRDDGRGPRYPKTPLASQLRIVARLIKADAGTRVYYVRQSGYDTHNAQLARHASLLHELAAALRTFLDDMFAAQFADRVAVLCFSEFGRTVQENGSAGTDHGTAGPVFLAGTRVQAGLCGKSPNLLDQDREHGDLKIGVDFRQVYASVLEDWLGIESRPILAAQFDKLVLFRT